MCVTYRGGQYFIVFASDIENYSNFYYRSAFVSKIALENGSSVQ